MLYQRTRRKNTRKAAILAVLARANYALSYRQIADAVGIAPARQVARDLQRYARFGYVRRCRVAGRFRYSITRRGAGRLAYFSKSNDGYRA